jgi:hypothetical protein
VYGCPTRTEGADAAWVCVGTACSCSLVAARVACSEAPAGASAGGPVHSTALVPARHVPQILHRHAENARHLRGGAGVQLHGVGVARASVEGLIESGASID